MLTERENYLRTLEYRNPQWIPCRVDFALDSWLAHGNSLFQIIDRYPLLFRNFKKKDIKLENLPPVYKKGYFKDNWGCVWHTAIDGIEGQVVEHPLSDWNAFDSYKMPDYNTQSERGLRDWNRIKKSKEEIRKAGFHTGGDGERMFDRLYLLRGFENLMIDFAEDHPKLPLLIEMLWEYEMKLVKKWLQIGVDEIGFHTDIGTQQSLMISPAKFRRYIKPMFKDIFQTCRNAGVHVLLSSDGRVLEIVDDLIECGVSIHDPQFRANTLDGIEKYYKNRLCANVDLDRQMFAFCTPEDIRQQVKNVVETMELQEGGLMVSGSIYGSNVPLDNIDALCKAVEDYCLKDRM